MVDGFRNLKDDACVSLNGLDWTKERLQQIRVDIHLAVPESNQQQMPRVEYKSITVMGCYFLDWSARLQQIVAQDILGTRTCLLDLIVLDGNS